MSFIKKIMSGFGLSKENATAERWIKTDTGAILWNKDPQPGEVAQWTGASDNEGYATGPGFLRFIQNGVVTLSFEGEMLKGKYAGRGLWKTSGGDCYQGDFADGAFSGKGVLQWADGDAYEGDFADDKRTGKGVFRWADGDFYEGDFVDNKRTGKGVFRWTDGTIYQGDFVDNVQNGKGIYRWVSGNSYEGDYVDGSRTGKGIFRWADGDVYEGDFVDGVKTGKGVLRWAESGNFYEGDFVDDERTGNGAFIFADGESYKGEFLDSCFHGCGIYTWTDGDSYEGEFAGNEPNGKGVFRFANGDVYEGDIVDCVFQGKGGKRSVCCGTVYEGEFADDDYNGFGKLTFEDGASYEGEFVMGEYKGKGMFRSADGDSYEGDFSAGKYHGKGILKFANGSSYEGDFLEGFYHGNGMLRYADGSYHEGRFVEGEMCGRGTRYLPDGTILEGRWANGEYLEDAGNTQAEASFHTLALNDAISDYDLEKTFAYSIDDYKDSPDAVVRVYREDTGMEGDLDLLSLFWNDDVAGIIVEGNLSVEGSLTVFSKRALASFLLVTGDFRAKNIIAGNTAICVRGSVFCGNAVIGHSRFGTMGVKGNIHARMLIAQDYFITVGGGIDAVTMTDDDGKQYVRRDYRCWRDVLTQAAADELLDARGELKDEKVVLRKVLDSASLFCDGLKSGLTNVAAGGDVEKGRFAGWPEVKGCLEGLRDDFDNPLFGFRGDDEMKEEVFLLYEGDTVFEDVDLDAREFAVIIRGNLTVRGNITNANTDGATSLIVLGSLRAGNIAVGGQTFHVTGELVSENILCGSYNHGYMLVEGDVKARLILSDDYNFNFKGNISGRLLEALDEDDLEQLTGLLDESVFDVENELTFNFYSLQEALTEGRTVLISGG